MPGLFSEKKSANGPGKQRALVPLFKTGQAWCAFSVLSEFLFGLELGIRTKCPRQDKAPLHGGHLFLFLI